MGDKNKSLLEQLNSDTDGKVLADRTKAAPAKPGSVLDQLNSDDQGKVLADKSATSTPPATPAVAPAATPPADLPVSRKPKSMQQDKDPDQAHQELTYAMDKFQQLTGESVGASQAVDIPLSTQTSPDGRVGQMSRTYNKSGAVDTKASVTTPEGKQYTIAKRLNPDGSEAAITNVRDLAKEEVDFARAHVTKEIEASQSFIANDIQGMTTEMLGNAGLGHIKIGANDDFIKSITAPTGNVEDLKRYASLRGTMLEEGYEAKRRDIEAKYDSLPFKFDEDKEQHERSLATLAARREQDLESLDKAVFNIASLKVVNNKLAEGKPVEYITPYEVGREVRTVIGEEDAVKKAEKGWRDYGEIDPVEKVATEIKGYQALQYAQMQAFAAGDDVTAKKIAEKTKDFSVKKVVDANPEFKKIQVSEAIGNEIMKRNSFYQNVLRGYSVTPEDIKNTAQQLNLTEDDIKGITPEDIKRRSDMISEAGSSALRTGIAPLVEWAGRHVVNPLMGISQDESDRMYKDSWYDHTTPGKMFGGTSPEMGSIFGHKTYVETSPLSPNYMMSLSDDKRKNFELNGTTLGVTAIDGVGQVLAYVEGGAVTGKLLSGAGLLTEADHARRVGLAAFGYITGYDRNKAYAKQVIPGDSITDEINRVTMAHARTMVEQAFEQVYPDYKFADRLFETAAGHELINQIATKGFQSVGKDAWVTGLASAAKQAGEGAVEIIKEGSEESGTEIGNAVWDNMFAPKVYKANNYIQKAWESGIVGGVSAFIPSGAGAIRQTEAHGPMAQRALFEVGKAPQYYIDQVNKELADGKVTPTQGNEKISIIHTLADIVKNSVPDQSILNNKDLTHGDKSKYANNLLQERLLVAQKERTKDEVQVKAIDEKIAALKTAREEILTNAGDLNSTDNEKDSSQKDGGNQVATGNESNQASNANGQNGQQSEELLAPSQNDGSVPGQLDNAGTQAGGSETVVANNTAAQPLATADGAKDQFGFQEEGEAKAPAVTIPDQNVTSNDQTQEIEKRREDELNNVPLVPITDHERVAEREKELAAINAKYDAELVNANNNATQQTAATTGQVQPNGNQAQPTDNQPGNSTDTGGAQQNAGATQGDQPGGVPTVSQQTPTVDKFFNAPRREMEVEESAKVGDQVKQKFNDAPKVIGRANTKVLNDGTKVPGRFVLTTAEAVTPSHSPDTFGTSEGFPLLEDGKNPNDRDYSIKENKDRVIIRSQNYDGRAAEQVPTVDKNGIVIDGNDRTMSGQLAARQNSDGAYIEALKEKADVYGFTPQQIDDMVAAGQHPRVIFVADRVMPYNTQTFAAFNPRTTGKVKTAIEEAIQFGRTASDNLLNKLSDVMNRFDTLADFFKNRDATRTVKDFLTQEKIINPDSITGYYDNKNHRFTNAGKELLQNLMLGRVFSEESLRLLEYFPGVRERMVFAMNNLIAIESLGDDYSLRGHLSEALKLKDRVDDFMQQNNMPMDDRDKGLQKYLEQGNLFGEETYSAGPLTMWAMMEDSRKTALREFTKAYLEAAKTYAGTNSEGDIFGNVNPTREEIINDYIRNTKEYEKYADRTPTQTDSNEPGRGDAAQAQQDNAGSNDATPAGTGETAGANDRQTEAVDNNGDLADQYHADVLASDPEMQRRVQEGADAEARTRELATRFGFGPEDNINGNSPLWKNKETAEVYRQNGHGVGVTVAEGPNGKWTNGISVYQREGNDKIGGHSSGIFAGGEVYDSREAALQGGLERIKNMDGIDKYNVGKEIAALESKISQPTLAPQQAAQEGGKPAKAEVTPHQQAIDEHNKYKDFVDKKQRKIELLEEKGEQGTEQYAREQAALKVLKNKLSQAEAALTKMEGKRIGDELRNLKVKNDGLALSTPAQIPVALWNAAVEIAASAVELGANIKAAVQQAVDYVNDRWYTTWDEQSLRDSFGENATFPYTADEIRNKRQERAGLSQQNRLAADKLVESVANNSNSLKSALSYIDNLQGVSEQTKGMLKEYVRAQITDGVFKATGQEWGDKHLENFPDDYKGALESLGLEVDTLLLNATSEEERQNIRHKFAAAKAYLQGKETSGKVAAGEITPVSAIPVATTDQFQLPKRTAAKIAQEYTQDKAARLEQAQRASIRPIDAVTDAVTAMRLYRSKAWHKINEVRHKLGSVEYREGSFYDRLKKADVSIEKFGLYLYAKHAQERNEYNAKLRQDRFDAKVYELNQQIANSATPETARKFQQQLDDILAQKDPKFVLMPDGGSGMTNAQSQEILDEIEADGKTATFQQFENEFRDEVVNKILDFKYDSGIIDDQTYNHLKQFYKNYIPLKVDVDDESGAGDGQYYRNNGKNGRDLYRSKGSAERTFNERNNPMLQAIVDLETSIVKSEQNLANVRLANLSRVNPNSNIWEVIPARYDILKNKYGEVIAATEIDRQQNSIPFFENGKKSYVVLHDPGLQNAYKKLGGGTFMKWVGVPARLFTAVNTLTNVDFIVRNLPVDQQDAFSNLLANKNQGIVKRFAGYMPKVFNAIQEIARDKGEWGKWANEWRENGGEITFMQDITIDEFAERNSKIFDNYGDAFSKSNIRRMKNNIGHIATVLEQTTRVMAYRAAREAGETAEHSAVISRNATVDFEKKGVYGAYINSLYAFTNAATQGLANLGYGALKSSKVRKFLGFMVASGVLESLVNDLTGDCDEATGENCYWEKSEWEKERNLMIRNPLGDGYVDAVPIGRQFGWFNYLGKNIYRAIKTATTDGIGPRQGKIDVGEFMSNTLGSLFNYYNPVGGRQAIEQLVAPTILDPAVQLSTNKNSFGASITPDNYKGLPEHMNYFPKTPKAFVEGAKAMSELTGGSYGTDGLVEVSPNKLAFLYQTALGGLGKWIYDAAATPIAAAKGEHVQVKDVPVARIFYRESNMGATKNRAFEMADRSKDELLSAEELKQYNEDLELLVEADQITDKQKNSRWGFVMQNQKKIHTNRAAAESEGGQ